VYYRCATQNTDGVPINKTSRAYPKCRGAFELGRLQFVDTDEAPVASGGKKKRVRKKKNKADAKGTQDIPADAKEALLKAPTGSSRSLGSSADNSPRPSPKTSPVRQEAKLLNAPRMSSRRSPMVDMRRVEKEAKGTSPVLPGKTAPFAGGAFPKFGDLPKHKVAVESKGEEGVEEGEDDDMRFEAMEDNRDDEAKDADDSDDSDENARRRGSKTLIDVDFSSLQMDELDSMFLSSFGMGRGPPPEKFMCSLGGEVMREPIRNPYGSKFEPTYYDRCSLLGLLEDEDGEEAVWPGTSEPITEEEIFGMDTDAVLAREIKDWQSRASGF
jgi:hypothetical protein